jgi:hypothetical protein
MKTFLRFILLNLIIQINAIGQINYKQLNLYLGDPPRWPYVDSIGIDNDNKIKLHLIYSTYKTGPSCSGYFLESYIFYTYDTCYFFYINKDDYFKIPQTFNNGDTIRTGSNSIALPIRDIGFAQVIATKTYNPCQSDTTFSGLSEMVTGKYLAFNILVGSKYHYGWLKISKQKGIYFNIESCAYDSKPNSYLVISDPHPTMIIHTEPLDFQVYPIPAHEKINVQFDKIRNGTFQIMDISGHLLLNSKYFNEKYLNIDIEDLMSGIYFLRLETESNTISKKIIKY